MPVLIDTSVLLAGVFARDPNYSRANQLLLTLPRRERIVPASVLSELFYMVTARISYQRAIDTFSRTRKAFQIEPVNPSDMVRMQEIMTKYADAEFDYADVSIMALAERLNIQRICTFDHTDFSIYQPAHCSHFELLP